MRSQRAAAFNWNSAWSRFQVTNNSNPAKLDCLALYIFVNVQCPWTHRTGMLVYLYKSLILTWMSYLNDKKGFNLFSSKVTFPIIGTIWQYPEFWIAVLFIVEKRSLNPKHSTYVRESKIEVGARERKIYSVRKKKRKCNNAFHVWLLCRIKSMFSFLFLYNTVRKKYIYSFEQTNATIVALT